MNSRDLAFLRERVSLLSAFSAEMIEQIASTSEVVAFQQGEPVVLAGEKVHALGIVLEGDIIATASDGQLLGNLGVGDTFGEMALMSGDPAIADLKAGSFTRAVLVPITTVRSLIMAHPPALQQIAKTVGERFQRVMSDPLSDMRSFLS